VLEGMYAAAAGMAAQQDRIDAVSNDLANSNTTGYKPVRVAFRDLMYGQDVGSAKGVKTGTGAAATMLGRSTEQGAFTQTDLPTDVAIAGSGFLQVTGKDGKPALTRDGHLRVNDKNQLTTATGELTDGKITLPADYDIKNLKIGTDGTVSYGTQTLGKLKIVDVAAPGQLQGGEDNLFTATKGSGPIRAAAKTTTLQQNTLEASGTDTATAMTDLIDAQRSYELASRAISTQDQMAGIANQVKR
jgi:flagellar basal-body rod protein FlgG